MKSKIINIKNNTGLHARPAAEIAKLASKYKSKIIFKVDEKEINAKSPLAIMSAGIKSKTQIEIICEGEDESNAMEEIKNVFDNLKD